MNCQANTRGAPADPFAVLTDRDDRAGRYAARVARALTDEASAFRSGTTTAADYPANTVQQAHFDRFGQPPAVKGGFLNRLTGKTLSTLEKVLAEEFNLLAARFRLVARWFSQWGTWRCIDGPANFAGCSVPTCTDSFAWSCAGIGVIFLCPLFWAQDQPPDGDATQGPDQQAGILIHEVGHIGWTDIGHGARGPGGNFRHAECYASMVGDIIGFTTPVAECPDPP
jgi:hypothetical protein